MRSAAHRRAAFNARAQSSLIDPTLTATAAGQTARYARAVSSVYPLQVGLRAILDAEGIGGPGALIYEAYFQELVRISRRFAGSAGDLHATTLYDKYLALGGDADALALISETLFSFTIEPAAPVLFSPPNGAPAEPKAGNLVWLAAARATGYDVYLYRTVDPPAMVSSNQPGITYAYAGLLGLTNYSWYIVGRNDAGPGPKSPTWTFTTVV